MHTMLPLYQEPSADVEKRVRDLLSRMTLEEKFAQLRMNVKILDFAVDETVNEENFDQRFAGVFDPTRLGCTYIRYHNDVNPSPAVLNLVQRYTIGHSRLGIPMLFMGESLHGAMVGGATVFPQAIGLGATFDPALIGEVAAAAARDSQAFGIRMTYAPDVDISQDPRWGRVEENYGEDPYLTSKLAVAYVKGLQGESVAACPKHYIAHGTPEGGINTAPVHIGEREIREQMLPPFAAVVREGGCWGMMPAYSEIDGVPLHASRYWLTDVLRDELGFDGIAVSDFTAVARLVNRHHVARNWEEAGRLALYAGIDVEAPNPWGFGPELEACFRDDRLPMELLDTAVARMLRIKFRLGLFENPYLDESACDRMRSEHDLQIACRAALESAVLLQNRNGLLPLKKDAKIALVGPNADTAQLGDYTAPMNMANAVTLRQALSRRVPDICWERGSGLVTRDESFDRAVEAVQAADAAILVVGDTSHTVGGIGWGESTEGVTCGEGYDSHDLLLPECQRELIEACAATGTPIVLVLCTGRPYALTREAELCDALIEAWYPGEQGGEALADLLLGEENFSGRLPISFPGSVGQIPCYYNHKISARGNYHKPGTPENPGRDYVFGDPAPLFRFGYGLSYSTYAYSSLTVCRTGKCSFEVSVRVRNTSTRAGTEVVQLYLTDEYCRITPFVERLRGFERVTLEPGEERTVVFRLDAEDLSFINERMEKEVENGDFIVRIADQQTRFTLDLLS